MRYGFIGTGTEGCTLLKFLATNPEGHCIATCDIYPPNLKKGVETIGSNPETYVDYRKMLERKDMDAVLIATPLNLHAQMVVDALNAGKHVFVEKTMYFKEEEGEMIRKAMDDQSQAGVASGIAAAVERALPGGHGDDPQGGAGQDHVRARPVAPQQ